MLCSTIFFLIVTRSSPLLPTVITYCSNYIETPEKENDRADIETSSSLKRPLKSLLTKERHSGTKIETICSLAWNREKFVLMSPLPAEIRAIYTLEQFDVGRFSDILFLLPAPYQAVVPPSTTTTCPVM